MILLIFVSALCPDPSVADAMTTVTGNSVGDTATFTCDSGFELSGSATVTCTIVDEEDCRRKWNSLRIYFKETYN